MSILPHASGRLIVVLSDGAALEAASAGARPGRRLQPLVADVALEVARPEAGPPPLYIGTPVEEAGGLVAEVADALRREVVGEPVTFVRNGNINYTNVCTFECRFCAFSKGPLSLNLRGTPYLLSLDEIQARVVEAVECGATEVCLQGGIHPDFDGDYYRSVLQAVRAVAPDIHVHGFTALEVTDLCPTDPYKTAPGVCGCGAPDNDNDGDNTPDCVDACPSDPDKFFAGICGCGAI